MVNRFNVALFESMGHYSVWFDWHTIIAKHHGQSVQRHRDRIDTVQFGLIQLTHYHRKASLSISSTSPCSNRYDDIPFDLIDTLSSQSIIVNRFNVALFESMRCYSVWFNWHTIIAKHHGQSVQRRLCAIRFNVNPIDLIYRQLNWYDYLVTTHYGHLIKH